MKTNQLPAIKSKFWIYFFFFLAAKVFLISFALQKSNQHLNIPSEKEVLERSAPHTSNSFEEDYDYAVKGIKK